MTMSAAKENPLPIELERTALNELGGPDTESLVELRLPG